MDKRALKWMKGFFVFLIACAITVICAKVFRTELVKVEVVAESSGTIDYQISSPDFQENKRDTFLHQRNKYTYQPEILQFSIPAKAISELRLNFYGSEENKEIILHAIKINGKAVDLRELFNSGMWSGFKIIDIRGGEIVLKEGQAQASVLFPDDIKFSGKRYYNWFLLTSVFFISIVAAWAVLFRYFPNFYREGMLYDTSSAVITEHLVFLSVVGIILICPILHIDQRDSSPQENRALAKFPHFYDAGGINVEFGRQFDTWLNDRFAGREKFIRVHDKIDALFNFGGKENDSAFEGLDGWLFYKGDNSVKLYQHILPFTDWELKRIKENLKNQTSWLRSQNIFYSVLIAPNKEDIYGEFYNPKILQTSDKDRVQQLKEYLETEDSGVSILYPLEVLLYKKTAGDLLYWKQDTHWNTYGAYWAYLEWMKELKNQGVNIDILALEQMSFESVTHTGGDLARMLQMNQTNEEDTSDYLNPVPLEGWKYKTVEERKNKSGTPEFIRTIYPGKPYKVLIFRDSFSTALLPYISSTFGEVIYIWDHDLNSHIDIIRQEKPDIILHEIVSRYTGTLLQDTDSWKGKVK